MTLSLTFLLLAALCLLAQTAMSAQPHSQIPHRLHDLQLIAQRRMRRRQRMAAR